MKLVKSLLLTTATVAALIAATARPARATEFFVTSVTRDFPMKAGEALYKDFYINAGSNNGLRKGAALDALRKMPVFDNINSKLLGDTNIRIARLKIIHVDKNFAIARLVK